MSLASLILPEGEFRIVRCDVADRLLACVDGNAALLYLYILRYGGKIRNEDAMRALHMEKDIFERALFTLSNLVLASDATTVPTEPTKPKYTTGELKDARGQDNSFAQLCDSAEGLVGRTLSESFLRTLLTIYEHMKLPADVIYELLAYVKRTTGGLKPREIEREAAVWLDRGVLSFPDAQAHLSRLELEQPLTTALLAVLGIVGRAPSPAENGIAAFCIEKGFAPDALALACARMNKNIKQPSMNYLRKILQSWDTKNVHTLAEITAVEPQVAKSATATAAIATPTDPNQIDAWEVTWLQEQEQRKRAQMEGRA